MLWTLRGVKILVIYIYAIKRYTCTTEIFTLVLIILELKEGENDVDE